MLFSAVFPANRFTTVHSSRRAGIAWTSPGSATPWIQGPGPARPGRHEHILPPELASVLMTRLRTILPRATPLPAQAEIPMSPLVKETLATASRLASEYGHNQIGPVHLLAALLRQRSSPGAALFRESGMSDQEVIKAMARLPRMANPASPDSPS